MLAYGFSICREDTDVYDHYFPPKAHLERKTTTLGTHIHSWRPTSPKLTLTLTKSMGFRFFRMHKNSQSLLSTKKKNALVSGTVQYSAQQSMYHEVAHEFTLCTTRFIYFNNFPAYSILTTNFQTVSLMFYFVIINKLRIGN